MYKIAWCTCKVVVSFVKPIVFWRYRCRQRRWILKSLWFLTFTKSTSSTLFEKASKREISACWVTPCLRVTQKYLLFPLQLLREAFQTQGRRRGGSRCSKEPPLQVNEGGFSSCECERSISTMRRLNKYMRCTMDESRLSSLAITHIKYDMPISIWTQLSIYLKASTRGWCNCKVCFTKRNSPVVSWQLSSPCCGPSIY